MGINEKVSYTDQQRWDSHLINSSNPHGVKATQTGAVSLGGAAGGLGTPIIENADLNAILKVGTYYCPANELVLGFTNCPTKNAFQMRVYNLLNETDEFIAGSWLYLLQEILTYAGETFRRRVSHNQDGTIEFDPWEYLPFNSSLSKYVPLVGNSTITGTVSFASSNEGNINEGGQINLKSNSPSFATISIDQYKGQFRIFGEPPTDGSLSGHGTIFSYNPYTTEAIIGNNKVLHSNITANCGANFYLRKPGLSTSWYKARDIATLCHNTYTGFSAVVDMKTTLGDWSLGVYTNDLLYFTYITDENYNANQNTTTKQYIFTPNGDIAITSVRQSRASTSDLSTGSSALATGDIYYVYE